MHRSGCFFVTKSNTYIVSLINVSMLKSSDDSILLSPCPRKSNEINEPNYLTSFAKHAKLKALSPAPCKQKNNGPSDPAV